MDTIHFFENNTLQQNKPRGQLTSKTVHSSVSPTPANTRPKNNTGKQSPPNITVKHAAT